MTFQTVLSNTIIDTAFSATDRLSIEVALSFLYNGSATARTMLDKVTPQQKLTINFLSGNFQARLGAFILEIDIAYLTNRSFITPNGKAVAYTLVPAIAHELVHAIDGLNDTPRSAPNFAGPTVIKTNIIYDELGIEHRLTYEGSGLSPDINAGKEYTNGAAIDTAFWVPLDYNVATESHISGSRDLLIGSGAENNFFGSDGNDFLYGNGGIDTLDGGSGDDFLDGGSGGDTLKGGVGNDTLIGGGGADTINGGDGIDTVSYESSAYLVNVSLARTTAQFGGDAIGDILSNIENIIGSFSNDILTGNGSANILTGGKGTDTLTGGAGDDQFVINTGDGKDTINDPQTGDRVVFDDVTLTGRANGLDNGVYKLNGFALQKQGTSLYITSNGTDSGVTIKNFFPTNYDGQSDYTMMGITIPEDRNHPLSSPIVLDLNGDGLKYIGYNDVGNSVHFDIDNDGFAEGMEWLDPNDGFLVRDKNGNGVIDNQTEMFGDDSGTTAYYKLAQFDTNLNNKIDAGDTGFAGLRIWQDANGNGKTEAGELKTLASLNIVNLSLQLTNAALLNNHPVAGTSSFTRTDGTVGTAADVLFDVRQADSIYVGYDLSVSPTLDLSNLFLPLLRGSGTVPALHYAMTQNPVLKTMVSNLVNIDINTQMHEVYGRINAIILEWAGATNIAPTGADIDKNAAKLAVIERYTTFAFDGVDFMYGDWLFSKIASKLLVQGPLHDVFPLSYYDYETNSLVLGQTYDEILLQAQSLAPTNPVNKSVYWNEILRVLKTQNYGFDITETVEWYAGFHLDVPLITGTTGDDILTGSYHVFQGFTGNDTFRAGTSSRFIYNIGDGIDTIVPTFSNDVGVTISFGFGISFDSLVMSNIGGLFIGIAGGGAIKISSMYYISEMIFSDGTTKGIADINYKVFGGIGTAGNDLLFGSTGDDSMKGFAGNDTIYGGDGNDTIEGGVGADTILGLSGSDTASYASSTAGVTINLALTTGQSGGDAQGDILSSIENVIGSAYNDTLTALATGSTLTGGAGIDALIGGSGNDTLIGGAGADTINGGAGIDTASYADSASLVNVNLTRTGVQYGGSAANDILSNIENIIGSSFNDILTGNSIANILSGAAGADTLTGGSGADTLIGGNGNDIFRYTAITDSGVGSGLRDIISDFVRGSDKVDLSDFAGTFNFNGTGAFTGTAHEVNYTQVSGNTILGMDADGNGILDFQIELAGLHTMAASDFLL